MTTLDIGLFVLLVHGAFGAVDTLYCHEFEASLPRRPWARCELRLHAARSGLYALVFIGLAWFEWHGAFAIVLVSMLAAEYMITIADALVEDQTRRLSRIERALHMILGATTGGYSALIVYYALVHWIDESTALRTTDHGLLSIVLSFYAAAVLISAIRDGRASRPTGFVT